MVGPWNISAFDIAGRRHPTASTWTDVIAIYRASFAEDQREAETILAERIKSGRYHLTIATIETQVIGFAVLDLVPEPSYAVLTFLAVAAAHRNAGAGGALCCNVVETFLEAQRAEWLLVEAEYCQAIFYQRHGFRRLALDYKAPRFSSADSIAMSLMAVAGSAQKKAASRAQLCDIIQHVFTDGYGLREDDPRLHTQLAAITDPTPLLDPETQPT